MVKRDVEFGFELTDGTRVRTNRDLYQIAKRTECIGLSRENVDELLSQFPLLLKRQEEERSNG